MSSSDTVTIWYLEQTSPSDLSAPEGPGPGGDIEIRAARVPSPAFNMFLYDAVGSDVSWTDRLPWTVDRWRAFLEQPGTETWVAYDRGTPAGYIELEGQAEGQVEISYFGLMPPFRGRGIGGHLLAFGTARAWDLAERWPGRAPTERVWVHTCSLDGPQAMPNYRRRGFRLYDTVDTPAAANVPANDTISR